MLKVFWLIGNGMYECGVYGNFFGISCGFDNISIYIIIKDIGID